MGVRMQVHEFVDEGLGHSSYVIDLGDGTAAIVDPPRLPTEHETLIDHSGWDLVWTIDTHSHAWHTPGAHNVELGSIPTTPVPGDEPVTVICGYGERAMTAASLLAARDVTAQVFDGGPDTWANATGRALEISQ